MNKLAPKPALYEHDFVAWLEQQAALARAGRPGQLDLENIAEELEALGISQRHALASHVRVVIWHLLKWLYQPSHRTTSWRLSIRNSRYDADDLLRQSPSLRRLLPEVVEREYLRACRNAADETCLPLATFPAECPFTLDQVLDPDFLPE